MATLDRIEKNYFGVTLYVTTRTGREYACQPVSWDERDRPCTVTIQSWPGYGHYRGKITLTKMEREGFLKAFKLEV